MSKSGQIIRKRCYESAVRDFYADTYNNVFTQQYQALYQRYWLATQRRDVQLEGWY